MSVAVFHPCPACRQMTMSVTEGMGVCPCGLKLIIDQDLYSLANLTPRPQGVVGEVKLRGDGKVDVALREMTEEDKRELYAGGGR